MRKKGREEKEEECEVREEKEQEEVWDVGTRVGSVGM